MHHFYFSAHNSNKYVIVIGLHVSYILISSKVFYLHVENIRYIFLQSNFFYDVNNFLSFPNFLIKNFAAFTTFQRNSKIFVHNIPEKN